MARQFSQYPDCTSRQLHLRMHFPTLTAAHSRLCVTSRVSEGPLREKKKTSPAVTFDPTVLPTKLSMMGHVQANHV